MSALLKRAHRVLLIVVAAVFGLTLLAPMATLANSDLSAGQLAIVDNPNGSGAFLRSDITVLDETTVITELSQGTNVALTDGPIVTDNGVWFWVATADGAEGFVSDDMLSAAPVEETVSEVADPVTEETTTETEPVADEAPVSPDLLWQEPIDAGFVVDNNGEIPAEGLACRATPTVDGEIIARLPVNATLQVAAPRIWAGDASFIHVNCADGAGYVNGAYVVLQSEKADEEPVVKEVVTEPVLEEVVTESVVEDVVTEPVIEDVVTEPVAEEVITEPIAEDVVTEPVVVEDVVTEPVVVEDVVTEPVAEEVVTEDAATEDAPVVEEVATETDPVEDVTTDTETSTEVAEAPVTDETTTETTTETVEEATERTTDAAPATDETASTDTGTTTETDAATETATELDTETSTETATETDTTTDVDTATSTEATTDTDVATETSTDVDTATTTEAVTDTDTAAGESEAPSSEDAKVAESETAVLADTAPASDISKMIGSATVTGTNGDGLKCRAAPDAGAATLMVLAEGTKVYVFEEAVNGYLGIDCGGLQGFADVNHLWSGGAGDGEITQSSMTLVVSGTGNGLNCRTGASTSYPVITVLMDGTSLKTRGAASNGWVPVTCAGQAGHVATPYVEVSGGGSTSGGSTSTTTGKATVVNTQGDGLYCRSGAGTSYSAITILSPGQTVSVRGANQGSWTPVICGNTNGFAHSSFLSISAGSSSGGDTAGPSAPTTSTGKVTVTGTNGDGLNCRSGASTSYGVITVLRPDQTVDTRSGSTSGWQAVICGGTNGFVSSQFVTASGGSSTPSTPEPTPAPAPSGMVSGDRAKTTASLNLRYDASLGSSVASVAPAGTVVKITGGASNGFYPVDWDGLRGYMSGDYLTKTSEALSERGGSASPAPTTPPSSGSGSGSATGNAVVDYAMRYLGYPYVWATHGPASFDCSGFTYWVVKNVIGKDIGYGTWTQVAAGTRVSRSNLQPGDLVFFQNTYTAGLSHVGIYIGDNKFIHAQNESTGVVISDLDSSYYGPRWYGAVRI